MKRDVLNRKLELLKGRKKTEHKGEVPDPAIRAFQRLAGYSLLAMSHPGGGMGFAAEEAAKRGRAKRWKELARKMRYQRDELRRLLGKAR